MSQPDDKAAGRLAELLVAFALLSRLPVPSVRGAVPDIGRTGWAWPLVGLVTGGLAAVAFAIAALAGLPAPVCAVLALAAGVLATGGLHEDGLADTADGFGGGRDKDGKLAIMRDSRIGSYGTLALMLSLALRGCAIAALAGSGSVFAAIVGLAAASRAALPAAILLMPSARVDGLGRAARSDRASVAFAAIGIGFLCLLPLGPGVAFCVALAVAAAAAAVGLVAMRQIGGQTGDVLGAMQQVTEIAGWIVLLAVARPA